MSPKVLVVSAMSDLISFWRPSQADFNLSFQPELKPFTLRYSKLQSYQATVIVSGYFNSFPQPFSFLYYSPRLTRLNCLFSFVIVNTNSYIFLPASWVSKSIFFPRPLPLLLTTLRVFYPAFENLYLLFFTLQAVNLLTCVLFFFTFPGNEVQFLYLVSIQ